MWWQNTHDLTAAVGDHSPTTTGFSGVEPLVVGLLQELGPSLDVFVFQFASKIWKQPRSPRSQTRATSRGQDIDQCRPHKNKRRTLPTNRLHETIPISGRGREQTISATPMILVGGTNSDSQSISKSQDNQMPRDKLKVWDNARPPTETRFPPSHAYI